MMLNRLKGIGLVLLVFALAPVAPEAAAQTDITATVANSAPSSTETPAIIQAIGIGDLLDISVFGTPELAQQVRVAGDGKAQLTLIGNTSLAGLTEEQAAEMIARELREGNFLINPRVNVAIKESARLGISVLGEVQHPGVYQVMGPRTILDVLSLAGGFTNTADTRITIKHRSGAEDIVTVNLRNDDPRSSLAMNAQVYPGDLVMVPHAGIVYVLGEVGRPGGFVMQDNGRMTLLQALAQAGSPLNSAAGNHTVLLRKEADEYVVKKVQIDKISRGQEPDVQLQANDIVFVPNSRLKSAFRNSTTIASTAASLSSVAIYGVLH